MREILFRAKRINDGEWVEGYYAIARDRRGLEQHNILVTDNKHGYFGWHEINPETVCQFTGLHDKQGNKIWENDIINSGVNLFVSWHEKYASWCLTKKGWYHSHFFGEACDPKDCEVIGNKFDNPELLKGGE